MNDPTQVILAALHRAAEGVTNSSDAVGCAGAIAGLQQELTDLGFIPPLHPELDLQLRRISGMLTDMAGSRTVAPAAGGSAMDDLSVEAPLTAGLGSLSQLASAFVGCNTLTICDETLLQGLYGVSPRTYLADLEVALPLGLRQLEIFVKPGKRDGTIATGLHEFCSNKNIVLVHRLTKELHDRVWIFDQRRAFVIGASFNGLTDKCAFILELPREDRERYVGKLRQIRERARWAPGMSPNES